MGVNGPRHENKRDHALRKPLETIIGTSVDNALVVKSLAEDILQTLGQQNIISYIPVDSINLLTPSGRIIALLLERTDLTVREMSVFLGTTEANINKPLSKLLAEKIVKRKKRQGRFEYYINIDIAKNHPDIRRLVLMVTSLTTQKPE